MKNFYRKEHNGTELIMKTTNQENFPEKEKDPSQHVRKAQLGKLTENNFEEKDKNPQGLRGKSGK